MREISPPILIFFPMSLSVGMKNSAGERMRLRHGFESLQCILPTVGSLFSSLKWEQSYLP